MASTPSTNERGFGVEDNGRGIPPDVVKATLDYSTRTSTNAAYVSPTRGQLGNALKCVIAAPSVLLSGREKEKEEKGKEAGVTIEAQAVRHRIVARLDALTAEPRIDHRSAETEDVKTGARVWVDWPAGASNQPDGEDDDFYNAEDDDDAEALVLAARFALLNPHVALHYNSRQLLTPEPIDRWTAKEPTSPHWYTAKQLGLLIAAHLRREKSGEAPMHLREFVGTFDGLSGSKNPKEVLEQAGLSRLKLSDLAGDDGLDEGKVSCLLEAMTDVAKPVKPKRLGRVGKERWLRGLVTLFHVEEDYFQYAAAEGEADGRPFVIEAAFGAWEAEGDDDCGRLVYAGVNFSPCMTIPFDDLRTDLYRAMVEEDDPVVLAVHLITPVVQFTDQGKARAALPAEIEQAVSEVVKKVTSKWTQVKRKRSREETRLSRQDMKQAKAEKPRRLSVKASVALVLVEAHKHVTGEKPLDPAAARQLMYAVRKRLEAVPNAKLWKRDGTFTQGILPDYVAANPNVAGDWTITYDARGHLKEPHTKRAVDLGTLSVRQYIRSWTPEGQRLDRADAAGRGDEPGPADPAEHVSCMNLSTGPADRYRFVLLCEKEGFLPLLEKRQIAERYDIAVATTKGLSTTSCRELIDALSGRGVTTLVLHDFAKDGLKILHTLRNDTRRYKFKNKPLVVDLGLRLEQAQKMEPPLEGEPVEYRRIKNPDDYLRSVGATDEEVAFLAKTKKAGRRVELNEMTNDQFINFVEMRLKEAGVRKVVPKEETLRAAYVSAARRAHAEARIAAVRKGVWEQEQEIRREAGEMQVEPPDDLARLVEEAVKGKAIPWSVAVADQVRKGLRQPSP